MAITSYEAVQLGPASWRMVAVSDVSGASFYWWKDGVFDCATLVGERQYEIGVGESVDVAVFDDAGDVPGDGYPGRLVIEWDAVDGAESYAVQEWVTDAWVDRAYVREVGLGHYRYTTEVLEDGAVATWGVVARGVNQVLGRVRTVSALIVRRPAAPAVTYTYDADTGLVTVAEV